VEEFAHVQKEHLHDEVSQEDLDRISQVDPHLLVAAAKVLKELPMAGSVVVPSDPYHFVTNMVARMAPAVAELTQELCMEKRGRFNELAASVEELCILADAELRAMELRVMAQKGPVKLGFIERIIAALRGEWDRLSGPGISEAQRRDQRDMISSFKRTLSEHRTKAGEVERRAVDHLTKLLLHEDERYQGLLEEVRLCTNELLEASKKRHWDKKNGLDKAIKLFISEKQRIEQLMPVKALQMIQESDNDESVPKLVR
jgi:hypothetical protein